jgi:hypothetical protein
MASNGDPDDESEMLRLQEEINIQKQCLEVCKQASAQVSSQKIHIIGEVIADDDCDQVVVTTLADLFSVGKGEGHEQVGATGRFDAGRCASGYIQGSLRQSVRCSG